MVRINLLRNVQGRHRGGLGTQALVAALVVAGVLALAGAGGGAWWYVSSSRAKTELKKIQVADSEIRPSTHTQANMVEDVVKDVQDTQLTLRESGLLSLPYGQLSLPEKINYEALFARNVFALLARAVPQEIRLESVSLDSFTTIRATGVGATRELVSRMLVALKAENLALLPKPHSSIMNASGGGYRFTVVMEPQFGLNLRDPLVDLGMAGLPSRSAVNEHVRQLQKIAAAHRVRLSREPAVSGSEKRGSCRQITYAIAGSCTYDDFVAFSLALLNQKMHCSLSKVQLVGQTASRVAMKADVVFTVRD